MDNRVGDAATCELIETFLLRLQATVACLCAHLDQLGVLQPERNLSPRLRQFVDAAGGVDGSKRAEEIVGLEKSAEPFVVPRKPVRDAALSQAWDSITPHLENVPDH